MRKQITFIDIDVLKTRTGQPEKITPLTFQVVIQFPHGHLRPKTLVNRGLSLDFCEMVCDLRGKYKGRFTRYDFSLRLSDAIFIARAARVMEKSYTISTISNCLTLRLS